MALLPKIEAAIRFGITVELLSYFTKHCPKSGDTRLLQFKVVDKEEFFDEAELTAFFRYLREPWPMPKKGTRPPIPDAIKADVKEESHYGCAICGLSDNGEVAHIEAVADSLNNK